MTSSIIKIALMFFLSNLTYRIRGYQFRKQSFLKSAESEFPKTAETDFSDFCRNKVTVYTYKIRTANFSP